MILYPMYRILINVNTCIITITSFVVSLFESTNKWNGESIIPEEDPFFILYSCLHSHEMAVLTANTFAGGRDYLHRTSIYVPYMHLQLGMLNFAI